MRELSLHILDVAQNALAAGAKRVELTIEEDLSRDQLTITVRDDGRGMDAAALDRVFDPFYTTTHRAVRRVGLGLPLLKAAAERCNGHVAVSSAIGVGTTVVASFQNSHLDRAPLGDIVGTLMALMLGGNCDIRYVHQRILEDGESRVFELDTANIKSELGGLPLTHPEVREWLRRYTISGEAELGRN